jgi:hypothetical protein
LHVIELVELQHEEQRGKRRLLQLLHETHSHLVEEIAALRQLQIMLDASLMLGRGE